MAKLLKLRRGTTTQHGSFTGAEGEVTIDTTKDTAVVHDGSTAGGRPLAREDMNNVPAGTILGTQLENSGVTAGQYGSSSAIPIVTVDAQGLVTAASTTAIDSTTIANGTSNVAVANNGNITATRSGTARLVVDNDGVDITGKINLSDNLDMPDSAKVILGDGDDLQLFHNGSHSVIADTGTGNLQLRAADFRVTNADNSETMIVANTDGAVELYHNNTKQVQTTADGVGFVNNCTFSDNKRAKFGDSNDLQIYHDGHSRISDTGSGALLIETDGGSIQLNKGTSENMIVATVDGKVELFHDGTGKIETQATGIGVSGNIAVTGTVDGVDVAALNTTVGNLGISNGAIASGTTAVTQGQSANNTQIATTAYVRTAITNAQAFPSGTKMLFQQTSAPTGWTKITSSVENKSLRVTSGTVGSGGNVAFTTAFGSRGITANAGNTTQGGNISVANTTAGGNVSISSVSTSGTVNSHTLSTNEMPSHYHSIHGNQYGNYYGWEANHSGIYGLPNRSYDSQGQNNRTSTNAGRTENAGGGGGHSHGFSGSSHTHNGSLSGTAHTHNATFSGSAHNHSISVSNLDMQAEYLDVIIAEKD